MTRATLTRDPCGWWLASEVGGDASELDSLAVCAWTKLNAVRGPLDPADEQTREMVAEWNSPNWWKSKGAEG